MRQHSARPIWSATTTLWLAVVSISSTHGFSSTTLHGLPVEVKPSFSSTRPQRYNHGRLYQAPNGGEASVPAVHEAANGEAPLTNDNKEQQAEGTAVKDEDSLKNMLKFAIPALGIYLSNPLLSNIDNGT